MEPSELKVFFKHIKNDFPAGEYPPYTILKQQLKSGCQQGMVLCEGERALAYSFCAVNRDIDYVLITLFAVLEPYRGKGIGSAFLLELVKAFADMQGIIVEVEMPELSENNEMLMTSRRRISFYEKAGFRIINGIDYVIWDIPMHLMALPVKEDRQAINKQIGDIMYKIYLKLMGPVFIRKMKLEVL